MPRPFLRYSGVMYKSSRYTDLEYDIYSGTNDVKYRDLSRVLPACIHILPHWYYGYRPIHEIFIHYVLYNTSSYTCFSTKCRRHFFNSLILIPLRWRTSYTFPPMLSRHNSRDTFLPIGRALSLPRRQSNGRTAQGQNRPPLGLSEFKGICKCCGLYRTFLIPALTQSCS